MPDLRSELLAVREANGNVLTAHIVVEAAAAENHPLHDRFEWDDEVAGHAYRLQQARQLIRVVRERYIDRSGAPADVRTFHAIPRGDDRQMSYEPLDEILQNDVATQVLLRSMEREWRTLRKRYEKFSEFREIILRDLQADVA